MLRVIYNGFERADFIYYLSVILSTKATRVIVNDVSRSHDLFDSVSKHSIDQSYEWKNILFFKELSEDESVFEDTDIYIEYRGENLATADTEREDTYHLIMPDYTARGISLAKECFAEGTPVYILRDMCSRKVTDKSFAVASDISYDSIAGHLTLSYEDMAAYVAFTINGRQKFDKCSDDMKMALSYLTGEILGIKKEKEIEKVLKKANKIIK